MTSEIKIRCINRKQKESLLNLIGYKTDSAKSKLIEDIQTYRFSWCKKCESYHNCTCKLGTTNVYRKNGYNYNGMAVQILPDNNMKIWLYYSTDSPNYKSLFTMDTNGNLTEVNEL